MLIRVEGFDLPGRTCGPGPDYPDGHHDIHVAVQGRNGQRDLLRSGACRRLLDRLGTQLRPRCSAKPAGTGDCRAWLSAGRPEQQQSGLTQRADADTALDETAAFGAADLNHDGWRVSARKRKSQRGAPPASDPCRSRVPPHMRASWKSRLHHEPTARSEASWAPR